MSVEMLRTERSELTIRPSCMSNATVSSHSGGKVLQMLTNAGRVVRKNEAFLLNGKTAKNGKYYQIDDLNCSIIIYNPRFSRSISHYLSQPLNRTNLSDSSLHYKIFGLLYTEINCRFIQRTNAQRTYHYYKTPQFE